MAGPDPHPLDRPQSLPVALVGAGAVARSFARALCAASFDVRVVASARGDSAAALCEELPGEQRPERLPCAPQPHVRVVLVAVPDTALGPDLSAAIRASFPDALLALHTSGSRPAGALAGAAPILLAFHPAAPFPASAAGPGPGARASGVSSGSGSVTALQDVFAALEGSGEAVHFGVRLARLLGMRPLRLRSPVPDSKLLYHAACCVASNYTAVTLCAAIDALQVATDLDVTQAAALACDLAQRSVEAVRASASAGRAPSSAITGPVARADAGTVAAHVAALRNESGIDSYILNLYQGLGSAACSLFRKGGRFDAAIDQNMQSALSS